MADFGPSSGTWDSSASDRDDAADTRDVTSRDRDEAADQRDVEANARDHFSDRSRAAFIDRLRAIRGDLVGRLTRNEHLAIYPDDWPDAGPITLDRLRAFAADQRRLAAVDRAAVSAMIIEIDNELRRDQDDRRAAARERRTASQDRDDAAEDRRASRQDRDRSMRDRSQGEIERELVDPADLPQYDVLAGDDDRFD